MSMRHEYFVARMVYKRLEDLKVISIDETRGLDHKVLMLEIMHVILNHPKSPEAEEWVEDVELPPLGQDPRAFLEPSLFPDRLSRMILSDNGGVTYRE